MEIITKALCGTSLRELSLCYCDFTDTAAGYLAKFITKSTTLQKLELKDNIINVDGLRALAKAVHSKTRLQEKELSFMVKVSMDGYRAKRKLKDILKKYADLKMKCETL